MTAAPTATAPPAEVELLRRQAHMVRQVVRTNIAGLTHEDSLVQPQPAGSCLNWVMGHLLWAYNGLLPLLGQESPMPKEPLERYARGGPPLTDPSEALQFSEITAAWDQAVERLDAGLAELRPETLDRPAPGSPTNDPNETVRSLLATVMFHQAYHVGQTALLRRIAGKEGAIA
jgi:DinB superfamily